MKFLPIYGDHGRCCIHQILPQILPQHQVSWWGTFGPMYRGCFQLFPIGKIEISEKSCKNPRTKQSKDLKLQQNLVLAQYRVEPHIGPQVPSVSQHPQPQVPGNWGKSAGSLFKRRIGGGHSHRARWLGWPKLFRAPGMEMGMGAGWGNGGYYPLVVWHRYSKWPVYR